MATIADKLTTIAGIKTDIRTAINNKGGSLTSGSPFSAYSAAISSLPSGGGGASSTDWSQIGYTGAPQVFQDDFSYAKNIHDNWDPTVTHLYRKFYGDTNLVYMPMVETSGVTDMRNTFNDCNNLISVPLLNTSACTSMERMFYACRKLATVPLFDTSRVTDMKEMFGFCSVLASVPLFDTSSVTNMYNMFSECSGLTSVPLFDTSSVTNMGGMFSACKKLTTVPAFNTSACTDMNRMFNGCSSLTTVPAFNTSACTTMGTMFGSCSSITVIPAFDSRQVTDMGAMFNGCQSLKKITSLDMDKCTNFYSMFTYSGIDTIRFMLLKGLGTPSEVTSYSNTYMNRCYYWGVDSTDIPDARQSLVDSLLTYSFDRAAAGYATCEIKLSNSSYNQLTQQELADIQAKGYNITT